MGAHTTRPFFFVLKNVGEHIVFPIGMQWSGPIAVALYLPIAHQEGLWKHMAVKAVPLATPLTFGPPVVIVRSLDWILVVPN